MKIAYLVQVFPKLSETFVLNQIIGMIKHNNEVDIYADQESKEKKFHSDVEKYNLRSKTCYFHIPNKAKTRVLKALIIISKNLKQPLMVLKTLNIFSFGKEATSLRLLYGVFNSRVTSKKYDIVHCQFGRNGLQALALRKFGLLQGKLIISFRGADISTQVKANMKEYKELFKKGDLFLPVCNYFKNELIKLGVNEKKIKVHRSGIDCRRFRFQSRKVVKGETVEIISIGRLVEKKGIEYGLKAFKLLLETHPEIKVHYTIVGDGPLKEKLKMLCKRLELVDHVTFYDFMDSAEVINILNKSHIFMAPCVTARNGDKEGIPNVLKEAMATGMPVLSTFHSGIPELVLNGKSGYLVEEKNENQLAQKLSELTSNPKLWVSMGTIGRKIVEEKYDISKLNQELNEIYCDLIK